MTRSGSVSAVLGTDLLEEMRMECNVTIQYRCNDDEVQTYIDEILSKLFDAEIDTSERKAAFDDEIKKTETLAGKSLDMFPTVAEMYSYGSALEKRKTGFSAFYFLLGWNADDFCDEIKSILKDLGANKVNCRKEWV